MRRSTILLAAVAATALTGCGTFDTDVLATVGDSEITLDDFGPQIDEYLARGDVFGTSAPTSGRVDGDQTRILLGAAIRQRMFLDVLAEHDIDPERARDEFLVPAVEGTPLADLEPELLALYADSSADFQNRMLAEVPPADPTELESMYDADPASVGLVCVRHILVDSRDEADEILAELDQGADFAELAEARSTDPSASGQGGAIVSNGSDCVPIRTVIQSFDPAFVEAVLDSRAGAAAGPVESSFGWHVILHRPWDEISDDVLTAHAAGTSGGFLLDGRSATTEIDVNPRYGTWNRLLQGIEPIG